MRSGNGCPSTPKRVRHFWRWRRAPDSDWLARHSNVAATGTRLRWITRDLLDSELLACVRAQALRGPRRSPDNVYRCIADAGQLLETGFDLFADGHVSRAALGGEGHVDGDVLFRAIVWNLSETDFVDQSQVHDIDWNFRVVALLKSVKNVFLSDGWHEFSCFQCTSGIEDAGEPAISDEW